MERRITYKNNKGEIRKVEIDTYVDRRKAVKESFNLHYKDAKILKVEKPVYCKHCEGEGYNWHLDKGWK